MKAPVKLETAEPGAQMDAKICFDDPDLVSFVRNGNLWITRRSTGIEVQLSDVQWHDDCKVAAATPSFIIQEEFHRYTGHWWQDQQSADKPFRILYEEIDESAVDTASITDFRLEGGVYVARLFVCVHFVLLIVLVVSPFQDQLKRL